jgi:hypothetical protein
MNMADKDLKDLEIIELQAEIHELKFILASRPPIDASLTRESYIEWSNYVTRLMSNNYVPVPLANIQSSLEI